MKFYVTFGQKHVHRVNGKTFDCNCVAVIYCNTVDEGNDKAFEWFDGDFHQHTDQKPEIIYYPRGLVEVNPWEKE